MHKQVILLLYRTSNLNSIIRCYIKHYARSQNPLDVDLVINLPHDGIRLIFDPVVQRLKIIEIYNMKLVKLKYCGLPFNSPEVLPSIEQIEHSFGATHPGVYDSEKQVYNSS